MKIEKTPAIPVDAVLRQPPTEKAETPQVSADSVVLTGPTGKSRGKVQVSRTAPAPGPMVFSAADLISSAATAATSTGATGVALAAVGGEELKRRLEALEIGGFRFTVPKQWRLPFSDPRKAVSAAEAARILDTGSTEEKAGLEVKGDGMAFLPLRSADDALELDAFHGSLDPSRVGNADLASLLLDMQGLGYELRSSSAGGLGAYGAYNILTGDWKGVGPSGDVLIESGGVTLAALKEGKTVNPGAIRQELKEAKDAVAVLAGLHKDITAGEIALIGRPSGDSTFAERGRFFADLLTRVGDLRDTKNCYEIVAKAGSGAGGFGNASAVMLRLFEDFDSRDARQVQWAFNYIQQNLRTSPRLVESFHGILKATRDLNNAIMGLQFIREPVKGESFEAREGIFLKLIEAERDSEKAIEDYGVIRRYTSAGETFEEAASDFAVLMEGAKKRGLGLEGTRRTFVALRTDLADKPEAKATFRNIFRQTGDFKETSDFVEFIERPIGSPDRAVRERAFLTVLSGEKDTGAAIEDYQFVASSMGKGENLQEGAEIFGGLLSDLQDDREPSGKARQAFEHIRKNCAGDKQAQEHYRSLFRKTHDASLAGSIFDELKKPVAAEAYSEREKSFLSVIEVEKDPRVALAVWKDIASTLEKGETIEGAVRQFSTLASTITREDWKKPIDAYRETRKLFRGDEKGLAAFVDLAGAVKSFKETKEAFELLQGAVKEETFGDRKSAFSALLKESFPRGGKDTRENRLEAARDGIENYRTVASSLDGGEGLDEGAQRFAGLLKFLPGRNRSADCRDLFTFIAGEMKKGSFPGKSARGVTEDLAKLLLITDSLEMAKSRLLKPSGRAQSTVEQGGGFVSVGGVKLPVKK
jgi:hypothetical protein